MAVSKQEQVMMVMKVLLNEVTVARLPESPRAMPPPPLYGSLKWMGRCVLPGQLAAAWMHGSAVPTTPTRD
jgi:hypothetical protein